jgi:hypothetical protein
MQLWFEKMKLRGDGFSATGQAIIGKGAKPSGLRLGLSVGDAAAKTHPEEAGAQHAMRTLLLKQVAARGQRGG